MHWNHEQATVHSGIAKFDGEKYSYAHFSDDRSHDHVFVHEVITQMADNAPSKKVLLINSDNCSSQYKCAHHFAKLQDLANTKDAIIIRIWSIAGHGKGEVDHVGGLPKMSI